MIQRFKSSGLVWPTIFTIVGLAVLVSLGNWQWSRMQWKDGLIQAISERATGAYMPYRVATRRGPPDQTEYLRVEATGILDHSRERHVYAASKSGQSGWHVFTPLIENGQTTSAIWVNRGFVPAELKEPASRPGSQPAGITTVRGLLRASMRGGLFVPDPDPKLNIWYAPDLSSMHMTAFPEDGSFMGSSTYIDAERSGDGWPRGGTTNLTLTNKHLGYALTWWGLALTLIGVYAAFAAQRLSGRSGPDSTDTDAGAAT